MEELLLMKVVSGLFHVYHTINHKNLALINCHIIFNVTTLFNLY